MQNRDIRCGNCSKLLAKGSFIQLEIKCTRCGVFNHLNATSILPAGLRASRPENARDQSRISAG